MTVQQFVCDPCDIYWRDKYSFWRGYSSLCPRCGKSRPAIRDILEHTDRQEITYAGFDIAGPLFECEESAAEKTEADLESDREQIHDEIAEALGSVEAESSDIDVDAESSGADAGDAGDSDGGDW